MAKYHHSPVAELRHQLKLSPVRLRLKQLDAIEHLVDLIEPDKSYPYDFVCHRITGYQPKGSVSQRAMLGKTLIEDLVQMVEDLSEVPVLPAGVMKPCWTTEELARRLSVSSKTICRWRRRGLPGRKLRYPDGTVRMAFLERSVRRFVAANHELVRRGAAFKQLTTAERQQIIDLARKTLAEHRMRLHELSQLVAAQVHRAVETVRYTLRRYDQSHPREALFGQDDRPVVNPELQVVYDAVASGKSPAAVAKAFGRSVQAVEQIVREVRARHLKAREIQCVYNSEFESPAADETILAPGSDPEVARRKRVCPPKDLPPYLQDLYRQPLFTPEQERFMFRRYNYLKFKAERLRQRIDVVNVRDEDLDEFEALLAQADRVKNEILRANLRLVVSIARRHVGRSPCFFEIVSDGNLALMRAVEKFDYARGFKFSTYASWAIMRNYARTIPEQMYESARLVTGSEEALAAAPAPDDGARDSIVEGARHLVAKGLALLNAREREVVVRHYGLASGTGPTTLDQIGRSFGVTKERVRQIERRALAKLQAGLGAAEEEFMQA